MARKTLLTESELHRFMKLAEMRPVGQERIEEWSGTEEAPIDLEEEEADPEALEDYAAGDLERGEPGEAAADELEADAELDVPMDEPMGLDEPAGDLGPEAEAKFAELMSRFAEVASEVLGIDVAVEDESGAPVDVEVDAELDVMDVEPAGVPDEGGEELEMGPMDVMDVEEDPPGMTTYQEDTSDEDMVAEITKRVAARLQQENKQAQMVDELAERIMKRLTK